MLVALNALASAPTTQATAQAITHLLNYAATYPDAVLHYSASDMTLHDPTIPDVTAPPINGAIHTPCSIMHVVLSSATEAELGALFYNTKDAAWLCTTLAELGHPQPPTPIQTDNACAAGILNDTVKQHHSKAIDMRFYWIKDHISQGQFIVHWHKGTDNLADYFTKHHSPAHHQLMHSHYLLDLHHRILGRGVFIVPSPLP